MSRINPQNEPYYRVVQVFNKVWYDYDEERGWIDRPDFLQIMGFYQEKIGF